MKRVFMIAGEVSGDVLGGRLMGEMERLRPGGWRFEGIGGERMAEFGLVSRFPMSELSLMGIAEIVPHLPRLIGRIRETARALRDDPPDALVTIDAPAFAMRVLRRTRDAPFPKIHYVAPQAWAWRPGRAKALARDVDLTLMILPFEPAFFEPFGVRGVFVGHPVIEETPARIDGAGFRRKAGVAESAPLLCFLPGSRRGELRRHLPVMREVAARLAGEWPDLAICMPTIAHLAEEARAAIRDWPIAPIVLEDRAARFDAYAASDLAIAASGTVTLELALAGLPSLVIYKANPLTAAIVRRLITVKWASLANIAHQREVFPEFLQERCAPGPIAEAASARLREPSALEATRDALARTPALLGSGTAPSLRAARAVIETIDGGDVS